MSKREQLKKLRDREMLKILDLLPEARKAADGMRETILSNLVMIGEVASPTFGEERRVRLILERLSEYGLQECFMDEKQNGVGVLLGRGRARRNILVVANSDSVAEQSEDPMIEVMPDRVLGPFVGDNSLALAALVSLPPLLEKLGIRLESNLVLMAASRSLGRGNLEGLRSFLNKREIPIHYGICVDGVQLGRLNHKSLGMLRGDITCRLPDDYDWTTFGSAGSIIPMNEVITRISGISLPRRPVTSMVLGSVHGGIAYHNIARQTNLCFEARSESGDMLEKIEQQLNDIVDDTAADSGISVSLDVFARRKPGGIRISHPLVRSARAVLSKLGIKPVIYSTTSGLAALQSRKIPSVTVGFTRGERLGRLDEIEEVAMIEPMSAGMAQLLGIILSVDGGLCDEK
jgi:tripeptide aminopeptidase